jgi:peptide chain release factor 2
LIALDTRITLWKPQSFCPDYKTFVRASASCGGIFDIPRLKDEFDQIEFRSQEPEFWAKPDAAQELMQQRTQCLNKIQLFEREERNLNDAETMIELAVEMNDEASLVEAGQMLDLTESRLKTAEMARMLSGEFDASDAIVNINAGSGGTESQDWAQMLMRMIIRYAERKGFEVSVTDIQDGEEAGIKSASLEIKGQYAYGLLKAETGVHRLVRISPYDANKRRHTSFSSIFVLPVIDDSIEIDIKDIDLRVDTYRASGAGGQHVNKTDSAVRLTHLPTGIVVACQAERSQHKNRDKAMKILRARIYEKEMRDREAKMDAVHATKRTIAFGSQIRSYVMQPYQMVKDMRTDHETSNVQGVLDGELDPFITSFLLFSAGQGTQDAAVGKLNT